MIQSSLFKGESWGMSPEAAAAAFADRPVGVLIRLCGFSARRVLGLSHPERIAAKEAWCHQTRRRILESVPMLSCRVPAGENPAVLRGMLTARDLSKLQKHPCVGEVRVVSVPGKAPEAAALPEKPAGWFSVLARFALQIEGKTRGVQTCVDRLFLVRAAGEKDAIRRLRPRFQAAEAPSLNSHGEMTRYRFEKVVEIDQPELGGRDLDGTEVFRGLMRDRRIRAGQAWHPRPTQRKEKSA